MISYLYISNSWITPKIFIVISKKWAKHRYDIIIYCFIYSQARRTFKHYLANLLLYLNMTNDYTQCWVIKAYIDYCLFVFGKCIKWFWGISVLCCPYHNRCSQNKGEGVIGVKCQYGSTAGEFPEEWMQTSFAIWSRTASSHSSLLTRKCTDWDFAISHTWYLLAIEKKWFNYCQSTTTYHIHP